ncbi:plasminogen-binding N-terminal domain-containing protein [Campylobacter showae]|uniref:plasminogen-binding N-terminal domain-containing protein n=1 Tax=Campylobacter showae TaxID=204 RepID=UPI000F08D83F|nr:plasminogen-binding N-terminal domain-containing protein [Campylobacter showae]
MKKFLLFLAAACLSFAAEFSMREYKTPLISVDEGVGTIIDNSDIVIGSSGVVMHKFDGAQSSIIARAVVTQKGGGFAKVRFEVFDTLAQKALPIPGIMPKSGDEIILNYLYNRSLIVVPNKEIYAEVTNAFKDITFIHPDIVGSYLSYEYKPNPSRDDFRKMCSQSAAGLIFIAMNNEALFADCQSFEPLKRFQSGAVKYYQLPFYTRVKDIDTVFWKWGSEQISDFDRHYKALLKEK